MEHSQPLIETIARQHRASDPTVTAWVSANAGSGKTHVLTQRVIRLLLQGVPPSRILCLTFTKAAAANMSMRVFRNLSDWSTADDESLRKRILATGHPEREIDLPFARRLFARTVETPGGLKIQTIHAFCEKLLHLFPFEADVGAQFRVIEEDEHAELLTSARMQALAEASLDADGVLGDALQQIAAQTSVDGFESLISEALRHRGTLAAILRSSLANALGLAENDSVAALERAVVEDGVASAEWPRVAETLMQGSPSDRKLGEAFLNAHRLSGSERISAYLGIYFTQKDEPRSRMVTKAIDEKVPLLSERLRGEQERLVDLKDRLRAAHCLEWSLALAQIVQRISRSYAQLKDARGALDFDDLIQRTCDLVTNSGAPWVLFKLDGGIDHILVDEAQDTSEPQWRILRALADEFFAGHGRRPQRRTFFAVGDEKQSI